MGGRVKFVAPKPTCADRYPVMLTAPVSFDGNIVPAGGLVELSDTQAVEIIFHERGVPADASAKATGSFLAVRPRAVMEWPDETMSPRQRKKWRPSRVRNRLAPRGTVRLDTGAGILEQVRGIVGR